MGNVHTVQKETDAALPLSSRQPEHQEEQSVVSLKLMALIMLSEDALIWRYVLKAETL